MHNQRNHKIHKTTAQAFVKTMLALLKSVDEKSAIICYDTNNKLNSLCYPNHVPSGTDEFEKCFSRAFVSKGQIKVKCRVTSLISLHDIKICIRPKLEEYHYFFTGMHTCWYTAGIYGTSYTGIYILNYHISY